MSGEPVPLLSPQPVIELITGGAAMMRQVGAAADLTAAQKRGVIAGPSAFVLITDANPYETREGSGPLRQDLLVNVAIVVGVTLAGTVGEAGIVQLTAPNDAIRGLLLGWKHPDALRKFQHAGEGVEDFSPETGILLYRQNFSTAVRITETYA
jgi:hypothetical protein